jgi:hypothetical protein
MGNIIRKVQWINNKCVCDFFVLLRVRLILSAFLVSMEDGLIQFVRILLSLGFALTYGRVENPGQWAS